MYKILSNMLENENLSKEEREALQTAVEASKKQLVKVDVVIDESKDIYEKERCGICNAALSREVYNRSYESETFDFCTDCGQAANW